MSVDRWLVALDIDGTVMHEDGVIAPAIVSEAQRLAGVGHEVMLATGRSAASALPVLERLGITPEYVVCSNGAITMKRDAAAPMGYRREYVESFDPSSVLQTVRSHLGEARFAVEDETGFYRYTEPFPDATIGTNSAHVTFDELLGHPATRVVVISPDHDMEDFLEVVERMGLRRVSYAIGWTAWLDISPDGVNKATALERVRHALDIPRSRVMAIGDGRNDIDMLEWASAEGRGVAMGQSPDELLAVASEITGAVETDGAARTLASL
ncbi:HAD family hydrolase [Compostimonas suwonensis]|uniref:Cof subfamily protein (Haloacid dehalogenase superfamily)/HAD superfamily hydrolase (TIGR01484 family) n=1 Tax=Compostimonas suwonensis TaxID=1048394 RepID=A0A2M9C3J4_9MICO|nr:HAD family hydrolase [Compostimonas suwonensis]PJJ65113.1 Cof subfamily protein (haloacid dehalogenase superfamily)/HAD superfamily hydrolase (TIGR01484 family) [Compostimonas suwonensis]